MFDKTSVMAQYCSVIRSNNSKGKILTITKMMVILFLIVLGIPVTLTAQNSNTRKTVPVKIKIIEEGSLQVTPAMVCFTSIDGDKVSVPHLTQISDTPSETKTFYSGIDFKKDKDWIGPVRKMNGLGNNENRSFVYELFPSLPYWSDPVMYQTSR